jgi:hypothetical protein
MADLKTQTAAFERSGTSRPAPPTSE